MLHPIITKYALILLWAYQNAGAQGFSKKYAVAQALGHLDYRYKVWDWSNAGFSKLFAMFNHNRLFVFNHQHKMWFVGPNLKEYLDTHFGPMSSVPLCGWMPFTEALEHNARMTILNNNARTLYRKSKQIQAIGEEFFFQ